MAKEKKATTINSTLRTAIVRLHEAGNNKAMSKDFAEGIGLTEDEFSLWSTTVKQLWGKVWTYVYTKKAMRYDTSITPQKVEQLRRDLYPMWDKILKQFEEIENERRIKVAEYDIEDLIGFVWGFVKTDKGTAEACETEQKFRKKVESLIGCILAKNEALDATERDALKKYASACKSVEKKEAEIKALEKELEKHETLYKEGMSEDLVAFLDAIKRNIKVQINEATKGLIKVRAAVKEAEPKVILINLKLRKIQ